MKLGVSSYGLHPYMSKTGKDIFGAIDKISELGYSAVEFIMTYAPDGIDRLEQAERLKNYCKEKNIEITAYTIGANLLNDGEDDRLIEELKVCKALGAPMMRHDISGGFPPERKTRRSYDDLIPIIVPKIRRVTEYAENMGIRTMTENHGFFSQDSERLEKLVNCVDNENFGILLDMGNFLCADENPAEAVGRLAPYVFHVHLKDFFVKDGQLPNPGAGWFKSRSGNYLRGTIVGHGQVPIVQCVQQLLDMGYTGHFSLEFEGMEDGEQALIITMENMNRYFPD